jgi:hypothetical protein
VPFIHPARLSGVADATACRLKEVIKQLQLRFGNPDR